MRFSEALAFEGCFYFTNQKNRGCWMFCKGCVHVKFAHDVKKKTTFNLLTFNVFNKCSPGRNQSALSSSRLRIKSQSQWIFSSGVVLWVTSNCSKSRLLYSADLWTTSQPENPALNTRRKKKTFLIFRKKNWACCLWPLLTASSLSLIFLHIHFYAT